MLRSVRNSRAGEKSAAAIDYSDETELADEQLETDDKSRIPKAREPFDGNTTAGQSADLSVTAPLEVIFL